MTASQGTQRGTSYEELRKSDPGKHAWWCWRPPELRGPGIADRGEMISTGSWCPCPQVVIAGDQLAPTVRQMQQRMIECQGAAPGRDRPTRTHKIPKDEPPVSAKKVTEALVKTERAQAAAEKPFPWWLLLVVGSGAWWYFSQAPKSPKKGKKP